MMRLSHEEQQKILQALKPFIKNSEKIYLFGSRVDDRKRGGDIDLLILTGSLKRARLLMAKKHYILSALKTHLGEQKIDLLIRAQSEIKTDPFLQNVLQYAVLLKKRLKNRVAD